MTKRLIISLLLAGATICAQEAGTIASPSQDAVRLLRLKYLSAAKVHELFSDSGVSVRGTTTVDAVVLRGTESRVNAVEKMIKEIDLPAATTAVPAPTNLDLVFYVISAGDQEQTDFTLPKALEPTIGQLRSAFPFKSYRVIEAIHSRVRAGDSARSSGSLGRLDAYDTSSKQAPSYLISFTTAPIVGTGETISVRPLNFQAEGGGLGSRIETSFDLKSGQYVVVGKSVVGESPLFLIVSAKVAE